MASKVREAIIYPFRNFNGKFIPHFIMDMITYLGWDKS